MPTIRDDDYEALMHYGILRKSGRYPWGSGGQEGSAGSAHRGGTFLDMVKDLEEQGLSRAEIAKGLGFESTTQLRDTVTIARNEIRRADQYKAEKLREKGMSATEIGKRFDPPRNESSIRQLLDKSVQERTQILTNTTNMLRDEVDAGGFLDVGVGTEFYIPGGGISKEKLRAAVAILKDEGYEVHNVQTPTATKNKTTVKVLCPPGTQYKDVVTNMGEIKSLTKVTEDGGRTFLGMHPPLPISSDRVAINYKDVGPNGEKYKLLDKNGRETTDPNSGAAFDGVIYVRPGVKDINLGGTSYAQVRINVDGTHYLKGMAMYKKDMPPGPDLIFNTNKKKSEYGDDKLAVMKKQEDDKDNPFGAVVKRQVLELHNGKERVTSVMNILDEEGSWDRWSRDLSAQVLSKQSPKLAERQLSVTHSKKQKEYEEIMALTNPTVRAKLLRSFSDAADADAVHLSAAGMPRSSYHVILPFSSLKDTEVYAPNFDHGERVALIRYPHGGTFEIPELTVNNRAPGPRTAIGRAKDAVGINHKVAERLSGADFDGDFVMVIPNNTGKIKSTSPLKQLENFDPHKYKLPDDAPKLDARTKGKLMGEVSNLITDMTIQKASTEEISRAVRHSMVVIDAEKHHLDYKRSAQDMGIAALKARYQGRHPNGQLKGASTLISRSTSEARAPARRLRRASEGGHIDPATGKLIYTHTGEVKRKVKTLKNGEVRVKTEPVTIKSTKMFETDDAYTLLSKDGGTVIERVYADHANRMKALANQARKSLVNSSDRLAQSDSAKKVFKPEVDQLKADLSIALRNSPRERTAQLLKDAIVREKKAANPDMTEAQLKRVRSQALNEARIRAGAKKVQVPITDRQWEAIQAGAVSKHMLEKILDNTDIDRVKELATPKAKPLMGSSETARAKDLLARGMTQADVARVLGVSLTTLKEGLG